MKLYNVGVNQLNEYDHARVEQMKFVWMVYWYEGDSDWGSGDAVALGIDGLLYTGNLGHCSCSGPIQDAFLGKGETVQEFFAAKQSIFDHDLRDEVMVKVRELMGAA
jgi:hypothetical protein